MDNTLCLLLVAIILLVIVLGQLGSLRSHVARMEFRLNALLENLGIEPSKDVDPEVRRLAESGEKIAAIKRYREITGVGLKEAKDAVERL